MTDSYKQKTIKFISRISITHNVKSNTKALSCQICHKTKCSSTKHTVLHNQSLQFVQMLTHNGVVSTSEYLSGKMMYQNVWGGEQVNLLLPKSPEKFFS